MTVDHTYFEVYVAVCIGGNYLVAYFMHFMRGPFGIKGEAPILEWSGFMVGFTEKFVALTLFLKAPAYLMTFTGGWVLLKFAIGWQRTPLNTKVALGSLLALIGNVLSFAIAIAGGTYLRPDTLTYFGKTF